MTNRRFLSLWLPRLATDRAHKLRGEGLESLAEVAGELMARGHARSGDACMIQGYCGSGTKLVKAMSEFACAYADQTEADYKAFMGAVKSGKIKVAENAG